MFRQLLDIGYAFMDAGMVFITAVRGLTAMEAQQLKTISKPFDVLIIDLEKSSPLADFQWSDEAVSLIIKSLKKISFLYFSWATI